MAKDIVVIITTNTTTDIVSDTRGEGVSLSFSGATSGTITIQKKLPDGTFIDVTDDAGAASVVTVFPTTINARVGRGADVAVKTALLVGTLTVTALPL